MAESMDLFNDHNKDQTQFVEGRVINTFFKSPDSFYRVFLVTISRTNLNWNDSKIVVTGSLGDLDESKEYHFEGRLFHHPKYGDQFQAARYRNVTPTSRKGLIAYLSGSNFPGIGKGIAKRVVNALGVHLIDIILSDSKVLKSLDLSNRQRKSIINGIQSNNGIEQIIIGLNNYGFGSNLAAKIFDKYHKRTLDVINKDPYRLVQDINGVNFKRADAIAKQLGIDTNSPNRLRAGLLTAIRQLSLENGDTYTTLEPLLNQSLSLLNSSRDETINTDDLAHQLLELARHHQIFSDGKRIYLMSLYRDEYSIAENLKRLKKNSKTSHYKLSKIKTGIRKVERKLKINYDDSQIRALILAIQKPLFLLTGGPGTGKTTIIKGIVHLFAYLNQMSLDLNKYKDKPYPVLLAAPTGRAAKRMNETTGIPASTIHRLLGLNIRSGNASNPGESVTKELEGKILIIDEMSMVDTYLFNLLVKSIPDGMKVILVGDKDQLPSVGPGQIFNDLLVSHEIPQLELTMIHRQDANSTIIPLAHDIKNGSLPNDFRENQPDRSFISCDSSQIGSAIRQIIGLAKAKGFTSTDMQVLAPMYRGIAGINNLNKIIQQIMNPLKSPDQTKVLSKGFVYRLHDKVLQLVNRPEEDIFNGDVGKIVGIDIDPKGRTSKDKITVAFDQAEVTYARKDWNQITLAYCTSIHKAQGSEFKMVILPLVPQYARMLKRNLLYTAVTRAAKMLVMIGDYNSFLKSAQSESENRDTTLALRLEEVMGDKPKQSVKTNSKNINHILTPELIKSGAVDPMIGMSGITPNSFMK